MRSNPTHLRVLNPFERFSEIVFGLIMVLSFTCALSLAEAGREDVHGMLIGAIGCNLAWGIIDAAFYLIQCLAERGRDATILHQVKHAATPEAAHQLIAVNLPPAVSDALSTAELHAGLRRVHTGLAMVAIGMGLVALTIALGG